MHPKCPSGVSLKRASKMQHRDVDLRSTGGTTASPATLATRGCVGEQVWATRSAVRCVDKSQSMLENQGEIFMGEAASMSVILRRKG